MALCNPKSNYNVVKEEKTTQAVTHPSTDHSQCCLTFLIKRENTRRRPNAPIEDARKKLWFINVAFGSSFGN